MRLTLKAFGPVDSGVIDHLQRELSFLGDVKVAARVAIPEGAHDMRRGQYRASAFLGACKDDPGDRVLGVTSVDLYEPGLNFVFGLATLRGRCGVISMARLRNDGAERLQERAVKEAVHELGHTLGLEHDSNPHCVMHFSGTLADTDRKGRHFCPKCGEAATFTLKRLRT